MAITPAISVDNPFKASYLTEGNCLQYLAVQPGTGDHQIDLLDATYIAGSCRVITGIVQEDSIIGSAVRVVYFGTTWAYASGNITRDDLLEAVWSATAGQNGRLRTVTACPEGQMISGIALEDATDGTLFKAFLTSK